MQVCFEDKCLFRQHVAVSNFQTGRRLLTHGWQQRRVVRFSKHGRAVLRLLVREASMHPVLRAACHRICKAASRQGHPRQGRLREGGSDLETRDLRMAYGKDSWAPNRKNRPAGTISASLNLITTVHPRHGTTHHLHRGTVHRQCHATARPPHRVIVRRQRHITAHHPRRTSVRHLHSAIAHLTRTRHRSGAVGAPVEEVAADHTVEAEVIPVEVTTAAE